MEPGLNEVSWQQQTAPKECPFSTWAALPSCNKIKIHIRKKPQAPEKEGWKARCHICNNSSSSLPASETALWGKATDITRLLSVAARYQRPMRYGQTSQGVCCVAHVGNFDACETCQIPGAHVAPLIKKHTVNWTWHINTSVGPCTGYRYGTIAYSFWELPC